jgi:hypothetical protein
MANRYWVGGSGTWDASNTANWSTTSGGASGASVPTSADVVWIDAASGAVTVTLGYSPTVLAVVMTGFTGTFDGVGSLYTISLASAGTIWTVPTTGMTLNGSPNITFTDTSTTNKQFAGGSRTYGALTIGGTTGTSQLTISNSNTFTSIASTKTVAHTINFASNTTTTIGTWNVTGTAGNVVIVFCVSTGGSATVNITNRTSGIDYLDISRLTFNRTPVTFYAGVNTTLRDRVIGAACITPTTDEYIYVLDSGTSFTTPANWNNSNNAIHLFAGGGGGGGGRYTSAVSAAGGGGGGGGGYTKATNVTLSGSISYAIGAAGTAAGTGGAGGGTGGGTTFNSGAYTTTGGGGGSTTSTPTSTGGTAGTGSTYNGGVGGLGATTLLAATVSCGGGGGGGAGGPLGTGGTGGNGYADVTAANVAGGGGGGNGGGGTGGNASSATGGTGGNNNAGVGGGASATSGFNGGGGGGQVGTATTFTTSGSGVDISNAGMGGGAGGVAFGTAALNSRAGYFGGGGCGGGTLTSTTRAGAAGTQGGIVLVYSVGSAPVANSNFFTFFNGT